MHWIDQPPLLIDVPNLLPYSHGEEYRTRVRRASDGWTVPRGGLNKVDIVRVLCWAADRKIVKYTKIYRGMGYCQQRSSGQLRRVLRRALEPILAEMILAAMD